IMESPLSVANTIFGKYRIIKNGDAQTVEFNLGDDVLPPKIIEAFKNDGIKEIFVIGHGTAAVAGAAIAESMSRYFKNSRIKVEAKVASELSGFLMERDFSQSLIVPITQSGTTTDTNRAVAMAKDKGAFVISIVNRRQSDITTKSDGVFYTSNGRDIEMSVASTKAFYSQIIAGHILGVALAKIIGTLSDDAVVDELLNLERIAPLMQAVLEKREEINDASAVIAGGRTHWAIVGSGPNKIASDEIRIKLSELCYKTISSDIVENKKHIDLSAEPLIIACVAGSPEAVLSDTVKDVAIFKAHKASIVVFTDEGESRFDDIADAVIKLPKSASPADIILNTLSGHLWGYYAACRIDKEATFIKAFRNQLDEKMIEHIRKGLNIYEQISDTDSANLIDSFAQNFYEKVTHGAFVGATLQNIIKTTLLLKYASGKLAIDGFWRDFKNANADIGPMELLSATLKILVEELSRPIDAIRHQAKTVTVGTSRKEQIPQGQIFSVVRELNFSHKDIISKNIPAIIRIQPVVKSVTGYTLYAIDGLDKNEFPQKNTTINIVKKHGVSLTMKSRAEQSNALMGTKQTILRKKDIYVGQGKSDGAPLVIIPMKQTDNGGREYLLLVHVVFDEALPWSVKKQSLGTRYNDICNIINEYNIVWDDSYLENIPLARLLGEQAEVIAKEILEAIAVLQK
ncbi:MAG: SIS domain-containing protein, partial [Deltaproteobacteria bacterium]